MTAPLNTINRWTPRQYRSSITRHSGAILLFVGMALVLQRYRSGIVFGPNTRLIWLFLLGASLLGLVIVLGQLAFILWKARAERSEETDREVFGPDDRRPADEMNPHRLFDVVFDRLRLGVLFGGGALVVSYYTTTKPLLAVSTGVMCGVSFAGTILFFLDGE